MTLCQPAVVHPRIQADASDSSPASRSAIGPSSYSSSAVLLLTGGCSMRATRPICRWWAIHLVMCSVAGLTACGSANAGFGPFKPTFYHHPLAPLSIPHLQRLAAFAHIAPSTDPNTISYL